MESTIKNANAKRKNFNFNDDSAKYFEQLDTVKDEIKKLYEKRSLINLEANIIKKAIDDFSKTDINIDSNELRSIYQEANKFIENLQTSFENLLSFHKSMLSQKIKFISEELPELEKEINQLDIKINENEQLKISLQDKLKHSGTLEDLNKITDEIVSWNNQKGSLEKQKEEIIFAKNKLDSIEKQIDIINDCITKNKDDVDQKASKINDIIKDISTKLYGEKGQLIFSSRTDQNPYKLTISPVLNEVGSGKRKAYVAAFDISYIKFCDQNSISCLHFVLYDQIEGVDNLILSNLLVNILEASNVQFIVSVLSEKIPQEINKDNYKILELSQDDKLFKIP